MAPDEPEDTQRTPPVDGARTYTQSELQSLIDTEIARRDGERLTAAQRAERRRLRDNDPFQYAEDDRLAEQREHASAAYGSQIATVAQAMDHALLDTLLARVPAKERARLLAMPDAGVGIEGRNKLVKAALDVLKKQHETAGARAAAKKHDVSNLIRERYGYG